MNQDTSLCHSPYVFASPQGPGWNVQGVFRGGRPGVQVCVHNDIDVYDNISNISADLTITSASFQGLALQERLVNQS